MKSFEYAMMNAERMLCENARPREVHKLRSPSHKNAAECVRFGPDKSMSTAGSSSSALRDLYTQESARIRQEFFSSGNGGAALAQRTALVERIALELWSEIVCPEQPGPRNFTLVALGGFGRRWLFPHSDIDLLFLHADRDSEHSLKDRIRCFSQALWDRPFKVESSISHSARVRPL